MKLFRMFGRNIRDAFKNVFRNFSLSFASILCITITLIIVGASILAALNVRNFTQEIERDVTITVFLTSDATDEDRKNIEAEFKKIENINQQSIEYKSKEQERQDMMKESEIFNSVMSSWEGDENPLKDSYMLKVNEIEQIKTTASRIKQIEKVEVVNYGEDMVNTLVSAFNTIQKISVIVVAALLVVTIFLIVNTIKLTIFSRKREISIMRLVGASNSSIKLPFIFEGMFIGIIGSIIPVVLVVYGYYWVYDILNGKLLTDIIALLPPSAIVFKIALFIVVIGALVGMIGSSSAVRKYLKV